MKENRFFIVPASISKDRRFYRRWLKLASDKVQKIARESSQDAFKIRWRKSSKELPFYVRTRTLKESGVLWFASRPVNYALSRFVPKISVKWFKFRRGAKIKPVLNGGRWFTPKKYKPDVVPSDASLTLPNDATRFFASKTSHEKTRRYKFPFVWYQTAEKDIEPLLLREQLSDLVYNDDGFDDAIYAAFVETVKEFDDEG